jgi:hypothetical protein
MKVEIIDSDGERRDEKGARCRLAPGVRASRAFMELADTSNSLQLL